MKAGSCSTTTMRARIRVINFGWGDLFCGLDSKWIKCYTKKIEACDVLHSEMWGSYLGINIDLSEHFDYLIVENGSKILIDMISDNFKFNGNIFILVHPIRKLLKMIRHVQIKHTYLKKIKVLFDLLTLAFMWITWIYKLQKLLFDDTSRARILWMSV